MSGQKGCISETTGYVSIEWIIDDFFSLSESVFSPKFVLSDATWYLELYPNGEDEDSSDWINVYLMKEKSKSYHVELTLGIRNCAGNIYTTFVSDSLIEGNGYGCYQFLERSCLLKDNLSPNDTIVIFCQARCSGLQNTYKKEVECQTLINDDMDSLSHDLSDLLHKAQGSDIIIKVGEREFHAHKSIIIARSPVFASMFEHDMKESQSGHINITDCDPDAFEDFLFYLYSAKLNKISANNVTALYSIADKYDVKKLTCQCLQFMLHSISVESFCDFLTLAVKYDKSDLTDACEEFFLNNLKKILLTKEWQCFMKENSTIANEIFIKYAARSFLKSHEEKVVEKG